MRKVYLLLLLLLSITTIYGVERFPRPEFESNYTRPQTTTPPAQADIWQYIDSAALVLTLCAAAWLIYKKRSRKGTLLLTALCLLYFGFWRAGCVCSVGSIQNVALSFFDSGYTIPIVVLLFFTLPLVAALFFGRVFCSSVCPLGAAQELVLLHPIKVPPIIDKILRFVPWVFLTLAILYAATGTAFLICEHDPFVPFFRLSGSSTALLAGAVILATSTIIARPYCRYLCPYGALLSVCSRLSWKRVTITPDKCINCRLCEDACPYGAINPPQTERLNDKLPRERIILLLLLILLPVAALAGGWLGLHIHKQIAADNPTIVRAKSVRLAQREAPLTQTQRDIAESFFQTHRPAEELFKQAEMTQKTIATGSMFAGGFLGILLILSLIRLSIRRERTIYEADRANCFACGRCYTACPREVTLRKQQAQQEEQ